MTLLQLFGIVLGCGILAALIRAAPDKVLAEPFKSILVYGLLVITVLAILAFFGLLHGLANFHL